MMKIVNLETEKTAATRREGMGSLTRTFVYKNFRGLHARPAALLVKKLSGYKCSITAQCNGEQANARSLLGLLCLAVGFQSKVTFTATGSEAPDALAAVERLFEMEFEEAYYQGKVEES
jgi:phosphotransferase system HPr (HPr) family protein